MISSATGITGKVTIDKNELSTNCGTRRLLDIQWNRIFPIVRGFSVSFSCTDMPSIKNISEKSFHSSFSFSSVWCGRFNTASIEEEKASHFSTAHWNDDVSSLFLMPFRIASIPLIITAMQKYFYDIFIVHYNKKNHLCCSFNHSPLFLCVLFIHCNCVANDSSLFIHYLSSG